ncbi:MAG: hypothetical protein GF416_03550 [Candidatus Altiarchaeales archaeon]|nr:hypothetical protein [Candidatus Altiarchaeales archaeon]MBD3416194.1 hypothetical protein [Candidatus Altiarchaeales archaeon]
MVHKGYRIITLLAAALIICSVSVSSQEVNMSVTIPIVPWNKIIYPDGVYEPYMEGLKGTHRHTFKLKFLNFTAEAGSTLSCLLRRSDGSLQSLYEIVPQSKDRVEELEYTVQVSDPINKAVPWYVVNCTLRDGLGELLYVDKSHYNHPLKKQIYVHGNTWTRFDTIYDDAYLASRCWMGIPKRYFNNSVWCDYAGDVGFAVAMSRGMYVEGDCHDGADGMDQNTDVDCEDIYCQGMIYSCSPKAWAGDPFLGSCSSGVCWETKRFAGHDVTYYYTRYVRAGGTLKVRFKPDRYYTTKPISYALTGLPGFSSEGTYTDHDSHKPENEEVTGTSYALEDPKGYYGDMDFVMYLNPAGVRQGWNTFSIYMVHHGQDLLIEGIPYYVSDNAPSNWDESDIMPPAIDIPCGDGLDNDLSYSYDCLDSNCDGEVGGNDCEGGPAYCEYALEGDCDDCFDNDADYSVDCGDYNCNGEPGNYYDPSDICEFGCEGCGGSYPSHCVDGFDNDKDGVIDCMDRSSCWGRGGESDSQPCPAYESNSPSWCADGLDNDFDGAVDCEDYDCRGVQIGAAYACPYNELYDVEGNFRPDQCFDNKDNDLDSPDLIYHGPGTYIDCGDPDCISMVNPDNPSQKCTQTEYMEDLGVQLCDNGIDDDSDEDQGWPGGTDCTDQDCYQKFDLCGPCPYFESFRYDSCTNGEDDDFDYILYGEQTDCADPDCIGEVGSLENSQLCEESETTCNDRFDNDADTLTDCDDPDCTGRTGPGGGVCANTEATSTLCKDNFDNDGDTLIDCIDPQCWGVSGSGCAAKTWSEGTPIEIPYMTPLKRIQPTSISYSHLERLHVNESYVIRFIGDGEYSAVVHTLGDATNPLRLFPYDADSCVLTGQSKLRWVSNQLDVGQIQHKPDFVDSANKLDGFDVTLTCDGVPNPQNKTYPATLSNLDGTTPEMVDFLLNTQVFPVKNPLIEKLEVEPSEGGRVDIPYGGYFDIRAIPNMSVTDDVSQCHFNISDVTYVTPSDCIFRNSGVIDDEFIAVSVALEDGLGNIGPSSRMRYVDVNVMPKQKNITLDQVFLRSGDRLTVTASFITAETGQFIGECIIHLTDRSGFELDTFNLPGDVVMNEIECTGEIDTSGLVNGMYHITATAEDEDADQGRSNKKLFYICNDYSSSGDGWDCAKADFDLDGIPDLCVINGSVVTTTTTSTTLLNVTTTTLPPETIGCQTICADYYNTDQWACTGDLTCNINGSKWVWTHDDRGDVDCFLADPQTNYCCCQLEGLETTTTIPSVKYLPSCDNGFRDENEEGIDCGGPCPPCHCFNGKQDMGELWIDCGGVCPQCGSCDNGIQDPGENGVDCGGPCPPCSDEDIITGTNLGLQPRLYIIDLPAYVSAGRDVHFKVVDNRGLGTKAFLEYKMPNGIVIQSWSEENGNAKMNSSVVGLWSVEARKFGHIPASAVWASTPSTASDAVSATGSILVPLAAAGLLLLWWRRRRKGYAASELALRRLETSDTIEELAPIYVTESAYNNLVEISSLLKPVKLSDMELTKADRIADELGVDNEWAKLLVIAEKKKVKKLILEGELQFSEYHLTKIVPVWSEMK